MHEMALAESILGIIEDEARKRDFKQVTRVRLEVGALAGVELAALRFSFDAVIQESIAAGALLEIIELPGTGWCMVCAKTVPIGALFDPCPECGGYPVHANGGREMRVLDIEVN